MEFVLNSSISSSTGFAPFELNHGYMPIITQRIKEGKPSTAPGVKSFVQQAIQNLEMAHDAIIESRVVQTYHANKKRKEGKTLQIGDLVYLSTVNLTMPKGRARKLVPRYIGPMKVLKSDGANDTYTLELPEELHKRRIHPTFHIGLLCRYERNDDVLFPKRDTHAFYDVGQSDEDEWFVDKIIAHRWAGNKIEFLIKWNLGDSTWEQSSNCEELEALSNSRECQACDNCPTGQSVHPGALRPATSGGTKTRLGQNK